jgi:hypothetical protein
MTHIELKYTKMQLSTHNCLTWPPDPAPGQPAGQPASPRAHNGPHLGPNVYPRPHLRSFLSYKGIYIKNILSQPAAGADLGKLPIEKVPENIGNPNP